MLHKWLRASRLLSGSARPGSGPRVGLRAANTLLASSVGKLPPAPAHTTLRCTANCESVWVFRSCCASLAGRSPSLRAAYGQSTNPSAETVLKLAQERMASQRPSSTRAQSDRSSRGLVLGTLQFRFPPLRTPGVQPRRHIKQPRRIGSGRVRRRARPEILPRDPDPLRPNRVSLDVTQRPLQVNLIQAARKRGSARGAHYAGTAD